MAKWAIGYRDFDDVVFASTREEAREKARKAFPGLRIQSISEVTGPSFHEWRKAREKKSLEKDLEDIRGIASAKSHDRRGTRHTHPPRGKPCPKCGV